MKAVKKILKAIGIYHPLQSFHRSVLSRMQKARYSKAYAQYKGHGYLCNACGTSWEKLVPDHPTAENAEAIARHRVIAGYGNNIICPQCLSTARERLVLAMLAEMDLTEKGVLHFSPEQHVHDFLKGQAYLTSADLTPGFYKTIDPAIQTADATKLSYRDRSFDMVIANHVLEHIPDDGKAMQEIFRVLKPGGIAILQVPYSESIPATLESPSINEPALQSKLYGQKDHVRIYALADYISRLRAAGFEVWQIEYAALSPLYKYAIQEGESFLRITKPTA